MRGFWNLFESKVRNNYYIPVILYYYSREYLLFKFTRFELNFA